MLDQPTKLSNKPLRKTLKSENKMKKGSSEDRLVHLMS